VSQVPNRKILIEANQLVKRFKNFTAVKGIDLAVEQGEFFGFLGPNGAGKSSTMRMIGCVSAPTEGQLRVFGMDPVRQGPQIRARLGVCPQNDALDEELSVLENLLVYARFFGIRRATAKRRAMELLEFMQLDERARDKVEPLSGGMKRRLVISRALINQPDIVMLDEPTTGLDPQARHLVWERLFQLKQRGVTQVLTTHYMDEAEQLCDRLVIMDGGRIVAEGSPRAMIDQHCSKEVVELRVEGEPPDQVAGRISSCAIRQEVLPDRILLYTQDGDATVAAVHGMGVRPASVLVRRGTLEDVFLRLTGRSLNE
jgi:lipooligosaccharide transport system ATP-binding protein